MLAGTVPTGSGVSGRAVRRTVAMTRENPREVSAEVRGEVRSEVTSIRDNGGAVRAARVRGVEDQHFRWKVAPIREQDSLGGGPLGAGVRAHLATSAAPGPALHSRAVIAAVCLATATVLVACSSDTPARTATSHPSTTSTPDAVNTMEGQVISAWRAAENAFYRAEADPKGLFSPSLSATMVDPELQLVRQNLAGDEHDGFVGRGTWDLGSPAVIQLGPTEANPTVATVSSCIHDMQILVNTATGRPADGLLGQTGWIGAKSTMVLTASGWKLSQQAAVVNTDRSVACAGVS